MGRTGDSGTGIPGSRAPLSGAPAIVYSSDAEFDLTGEAPGALQEADSQSSNFPGRTRGVDRTALQGSAFGTFLMLGFMIALLDKLQAAPSDPTLQDDPVTYKDLEHGTLLIAPKGGDTRGVVLDDPELTIIIGSPEAGYTVQQVVNSPADMAVLLAASDAVTFIYQLGQADPFTTGSTQRAETQLFLPDQPNTQLASAPLNLLPPMGDNPNVIVGTPESAGSNAPPPVPVLLGFSIGNDRVLSHDETPGVQMSDTDEELPVVLTDLGDPESIGRAQIGDATNPFITTTGTVPANFTVLVTVEAEDGTPSGLSVTGGGPIYLYTENINDAADQVVVGRVGSNEGPDPAGAIAFIVYATPDGEQLWIQESLPIDHGDDGNDFDSVQSIVDAALRIHISVNDGTNTVEQTMEIGERIGFVDDGPIAQNDTVQLIADSDQDFNVAFVLDFSGSITNAQFNEQKAAVLAAGQKIFNGTSGDVSISLIAFASGAAVLGDSPFTTLEDFQDAVNALSASSRGISTGATNYTAALNTTMGHFEPEADATNLVFFVSDGNPNQQGNVNNPIQAGTAAAWNSFVNSDNYDLQVTSIGIGSNIQTGPLQAVDVDGNGAPIMIDGFGDLVQTLLDQIVGGEAHGNVLFGSDGVQGGGDDDDFGADGQGYVSSLRFDSNRDGVLDSSDGPGYFFDGQHVLELGEIISDSSELTFDLEPGTTFTFNFETGEWTYTTNQVIDEQFAEHFAYTITDGDGDQTEPALLTVLPPSDPVALYLESAQQTATD